MINEIFQRAVSFHQSGNLAQAEPLYRQVLQAEPAHAEALHRLGLLAFQTGHQDAAASLLLQALALYPKAHSAEARNQLGGVLFWQEKYAEAAQCYQEALRINPNFGEAHNNLGLAFKALERFAEAEECYRQAQRINPTFADAFINQGLAYKDQRKFAEAAQCFQQAATIQAGHGMARWNLSLLRLLHGDFQGGWPDFEQRWSLPGVMPRSFPQPRWDGSPLAGRTILVYAEMGLGDTIHFSRFLSQVKQRGGPVILECQPPLCHLVAHMKGVDQIVPAGIPLPPFDVQIPLLSLPALLGTTLATIPTENPYLKADPKLIDHWRQELRRASRRKPDVSDPTFKIGIAWQSNPKHTGRQRKSISLLNFAPLARVEGVELVSLQVGPGIEQLQTAPFPVTDLGSHFDPNSLTDLAAAIMNLDLVVSIDTAVPHLAGALGVPVWVALPFVACWRWLLERTDTPWYPGMRLFRQNKLGNWSEVFEQIAAEVQKQIRNKPEL